jgi:hypothetical protein
MKQTGINGPRLAELATETGVHVAQSTIATWLKPQRPGRPAQVFAVERALGLPPGALSGYLGYLPADLFRISVETALALDGTLVESQRSGVRKLLADLRAGESERGRPSKRSSK